MNSSLFDLAIEHIFWHKAGCDHSLVKESIVEHLLHLNSSLNIILVKFDPNIAGTILLNPDFFNFTHFTADVSNLFFNVDEETRIFSQIDILIKHVIE